MVKPLSPQQVEWHCKDALGWGETALRQFQWKMDKIYCNPTSESREEFFLIEEP